MTSPTRQQSSTTNTDDRVTSGDAREQPAPLTCRSLAMTSIALRRALGEDETSTFTTAHYVVGGALGAACFGDDDPTLTQAWEALSVITPSLQLADLGLFGSFESTEGGDEVTLAFVNTLDDDRHLVPDVHQPRVLRGRSK